MKLNTNKAMKINEEIDAALKLLREVQPPMEMMSRVHRRLENATAGRTRRGLLFWVPAACAAMAMIVVVIFIQTHSRQGKQISAVEIAKAVVAPTALPDRAMMQSTMVAAESFRKQELVSEHAHPTSRRQHGEYRHAANLLSYPLTRQEKLLVRFAETAGPDDLQALNPEYQVKIEAQQEAEFAAYLKSGSSSSDNGTIEATENTQE